VFVITVRHVRFKNVPLNGLQPGNISFKRFQH